MLERVRTERSEDRGNAVVYYAKAGVRVRKVPEHRSVGRDARETTSACT